MSVLTGHEILRVTDNDYLPDIAREAIRSLLRYNLAVGPHDYGYYGKINRILKSVPGFEYIPSDDRLSHMISQLPENAQSADLKVIITKDMSFRNIYFEEPCFLGFDLGKYLLALQEEPVGYAGIFFIKQDKTDWKGFNPRLPLVPTALTSKTFNGYIDALPGPLDSQFCQYMESRAAR